MFINKKNAALLFILFLMTILMYFSCSRPSATDDTANATWSTENEQLTIAVEVLEVSRGKLIPYIESSGIAYGTREAWAVSETRGKITDVKVIPGQSVKKGEIILQVEQNISRLNRDLSFEQYESSRLDFEAIESSYKSGGYSRSDYNAARIKVLQAQSAYETASKIFNDTSIKAPFDGSIAILDSSLTAGNFLTEGIQIARIVDTSSMKIEISVGERQVSLIAPGLPARVRISSDSNSKIIEAEVAAIGSGSDRGTGSYSVLITWKNPVDVKMRSGLSATVEIDTVEKYQNIIIPSSAIIIRDRKQSVIIAENGKTRIKPIETGQALGGHTVVTSGLEEGEKLVVSALSSLGNDYDIETTLVGTTGDWR